MVLRINLDLKLRLRLAAYIGLVSEKSPRHLSVMQAAELVAHLPAHIQCVGLFVNPTDAQLAKTLEAVPLDLIQLHGTESPERVRCPNKIWAGGDQSHCH